VVNDGDDNSDGMTMVLTVDVNDDNDDDDDDDGKDDEGKDAIGTTNDLLVLLMT
jgi:hypothetical protein